MRRDPCGGRRARARRARRRGARARARARARLRGLPRAPRRACRGGAGDPDGRARRGAAARVREPRARRAAAGRPARRPPPAAAPAAGDRRDRPARGRRRDMGHAVGDARGSHARRALPRGAGDGRRQVPRGPRAARRGGRQARGRVRLPGRAAVGDGRPRRRGRATSPGASRSRRATARRSSWASSSRRPPARSGGTRCRSRYARSPACTCPARTGASCARDFGTAEQRRLSPRLAAAYARGSTTSLRASPADGRTSAVGELVEPDRLAGERAPVDGAARQQRERAVDLGAGCDETRRGRRARRSAAGRTAASPRSPPGSRRRARPCRRAAPPRSPLATTRAGPRPP